MLRGLHRPSQLLLGPSPSDDVLGPDLPPLPLFVLMPRRCSGSSARGPPKLRRVLVLALAYGSTHNYTQHHVCLKIASAAQILTGQTEHQQMVQMTNEFDFINLLQVLPSPHSTCVVSHGDCRSEIHPEVLCIPHYYVRSTSMRISPGTCYIVLCTWSNGPPTTHLERAPGCVCDTTA